MKKNIKKAGNKITREQFMEFFRDNYSLNKLSVDYRLEIFNSILLGSSDITVTNLEELCANYSIEHYRNNDGSITIYEEV